MAEKKLRGLLDRAQATIGGLLGDFPQGFNAGAVAGVAGYPGDIAYMLDTAGRAITGQDTQPAAQDFPGTTDYIAAKAGYPIPGSFSGQLGAAVGGMLTPGPGDLAKFAPVLSAIPFWHGSPHKYDAVDLSKIGTGEGAQAYGWGYYGADAKETAEQYQRVLGGEDTQFFVGDKQVFPEQMDAFESSALNAIAYGNTPEQALTNYESQGVQQAALDELRPILERFHSAGVKRVDIPKENSSLYKGEYRWPDPAKESATPLTGEDLLQWDRPLSEQSESVRSGVKEAWAKSLDAAGKSDEAAKIREMDGLPDWVLERPGERLFGLFGGMDREGTAEKLLRESGVPGLRYLDGMSRDGGKGTYNIVMFDEKGIKLLERNGSPIEDFAARRAGKAKPYREAMGLPMDEASRMQRAQEMGFDTPAVHWSRHGVDVNELDSGKFAIAPFDAVGTHVGTPEAAMKRFEGWASPERGAGVTYPVVIKSKKPYLDPSGKPWNEQQLTEHLREIGGYDSARASYKELNSKLRDKIFAEYDSIPYINDVEDAGSISYIAPPQNIRSRFAAFDPSKKDSANLLAGLAALGVGTAAVKSQQEKERRNGL